MSNYPNPEYDFFNGLSRCYVAAKTGAIIAPYVIDIHPVSGRCNLDCRWCFGRVERKIIEPLPEVLTKETLIYILGKVLDSRWYPLWPSEFHICGNDSEPLLSDAVLPTIRFLLQRNRIVELVTNGLMLDKPDIISTVSRINKLNISLDVTNDDDYQKFKLPKGISLDGYTRVLNNIRNIIKYRKENEIKSKLHISVSFVATTENYTEDKFHNCFNELRDIGVNRIRVRDDLFEIYGKVSDLKCQIKNMNANIEEIDIDYISPEKPYSEFVYCRGPRLWPALAADGYLYPCAHVANSKYQPFGNLMTANSLIELYQELFYPPGKSFITVERIGCHRQCPSVLGRYNEPSLVEKILKKSSFI